MSTETGIQIAIRMAGGTRPLAELLGVSPQVIRRWRARGFVPWRRAIQLGQMFDVPSRTLLHPALARTICR